MFILFSSLIKISLIVSCSPRSSSFDIKFNFLYRFRNGRTRNAPPPFLFATNGHMPFCCWSWCVSDERITSESTSTSKTTPFPLFSIIWKINANRDVVYYRAVCYWVGFLCPLIIPSIQSRVDNLEVELSIFSFVVFQLEQFGKQESVWVIRVLIDSISIGL